MTVRHYSSKGLLKDIIRIRFLLNICKVKIDHLQRSGQTNEQEWDFPTSFALVDLFDSLIRPSKECSAAEATNSSVVRAMTLVWRGLFRANQADFILIHASILEHKN